MKRNNKEKKIEITWEIVEQAYQGIGAYEATIERNMGMKRFVLPAPFIPWDMSKADMNLREMSIASAGKGVAVLMFRHLWRDYVCWLYSNMQKKGSITLETFTRMYQDRARIVRLAARNRICLPKKIVVYLELDACNTLILRPCEAFILIMSKRQYDAGDPDAENEISKLPPDIFLPTPASSRLVPSIA